MATKPEDAMCGRKKCGEFNMLMCCRSAGHDGDCNYVVDHDNGYPARKAERERGRQAKRKGPRR